MAETLPDRECLLHKDLWHSSCHRRWFVSSLFFEVYLEGAIIGKEGPLVHLASIAEDQLSKRIGVFRKLRTVCPLCSTRS